MLTKLEKKSVMFAKYTLYFVYEHYYISLEIEAIFCKITSDLFFNQLIVDGSFPTILKQTIMIYSLETITNCV